MSVEIKGTIETVSVDGEVVFDAAARAAEEAAKAEEEAKAKAAEAAAAQAPPPQEKTEGKKDDGGEVTEPVAEAPVATEGAETTAPAAT